MAKFGHALIMAAGRGNRMMPLTDSIPKPMAPFQNTTLIGASIAKVQRYVDHLHVTVGYKGAMLAKHLIEQGVSSIFNTENKTNSWWIYHTLLRDLDEPVVVLTCDNVTDLDFDLLARDYFSKGEPACMLVAVKPVPGLEGDYITHEKGKVTKISRTEPTDIYCSGIQILNPRKINFLTQDDGDFYSVWRQLIGKEQLLVSSTYPKAWFTVDTVEDLEKISLRTYSQKTDSGANR